MLDGVTLVGYDLAEDTVESGDELSLILYWQIFNSDNAGEINENYWIGEQFHHQHILWGGLLDPYARIQDLQTGEIIREQINLVIPSTLEGSYSLNMVLTQNNEKIEIFLNDIIVQDEMGMVDGWLQ